MVELKALSAATGCRILAKAEYLNPGGSPKDRVARALIEDALARNPGVRRVYEGTSGSTGISLARVAAAAGLEAVIFMPSDQAVEKAQLLATLGARVQRVPPVAIVDPGHYVRRAQTAAENDPDGVFADQFETPVNWKAHYTTTGPEIWRQTSGKVDAVVMAAGTGGTLAGVTTYLKEVSDEHVQAYLVDPQGSALYYAVTKGVCYSPTQDEGRRKRNQVDTIAEGIGLYRRTANFDQALDAGIAGAFKCSDQEALDMSRFLLHREGLFLGSSSAVNCVGAAKLAARLGPGHTIVTLLCDDGSRHLTKLWNEDFLTAQGLVACISPDCYASVYGEAGLEEGEVDQADTKYRLCVYAELDAEAKARRAARLA
ncbi:uncharacterized protein AMSG_12047 [Thecamonas trahens ATCC 50062]|uniref:cysteine synthase n=1 Tax=Thecamonas trahens ATCC 50062 TaxID=461836 RepID=A0A0L0DHY0_THETB|nr:hypothetical protein AMSG_12047 [Thecamonas trahens ATCC 50062]KNC50908.1 hypothetical protein AMSG_12047 [Thecamonas trahens ATCC 50062]|eukprot:XP_013756675.1 hypothetical protein AMSG_12047 [Thecamonas trahens ATCC 50062]